MVRSRMEDRQTDREREKERERSAKRRLQNWPAEGLDGLSEGVLEVRVGRVVDDELGVVAARVVDVAVLGDQLDAVDADVDAQTGLAVPVEVGRLRHVGDVVGRLEVSRGVQVFDDHVARRTNLRLTCIPHSAIIIIIIIIVFYFPT